MKYIADLHTHSYYSRATAKSSCLEGFYQWARIKGINLVGTGDFTHPKWRDEIGKKCVIDSDGFLTLKKPPRDLPQGFEESQVKTEEIPVRFVLSAEISSIYKKGDKTRKIHNILFAPSLEAADRISKKLLSLGANLTSDGRPILGLSAKDLLEITLEADDQAYLVPAHVWTPWFSLFGSKSGFDSIEDCFEDLTPHIFALETGLSSDPPMNRLWSKLDQYTLISNSDAHSPQKLGREANVFDTEFTYSGMFKALKTRKGFLGTYEFYPEEGKYHFDGHRKCNIVLDPLESKKLNGICPLCHKPLTLGVAHRVYELSDRKKEASMDETPFKYLIPLPEVVSEILGKGPSSKTVQSFYARLIHSFGSEFNMLLHAPLDEVESKAGALWKEAMKKMRTGKVNPKAGYDGEFGVIRVFDDQELDKLKGQESFFKASALKKKAP
ncbi:MAG: hypothetical protein JXR70_15300 [Spirochaetales bacterium]|nr:hypothetical protein [Spirochaetales bacterium]